MLHKQLGLHACIDSLTWQYFCTRFSGFDLLQALIGVADRSLMEIPDIDAPLRQNIAEHMAFVHVQVAEESKR